MEPPEEFGQIKKLKCHWLSLPKRNPPGIRVGWKNWQSRGVCRPTTGQGRGVSGDIVGKEQSRTTEPIIGTEIMEEEFHSKLHFSSAALGEEHSFECPNLLVEVIEEEKQAD